MNAKDMTDEELWRGYENACRCGSCDAEWMKDEIEARLAKRNEKQRLSERAVAEAV